MAAAQKLIRLIEQRGTTQGEVETAVDLPQGRISKWSAGQGEPTLGQGLRLARFFGVQLEWLADDELDELPPEQESGDFRTIVAIIGVMGSREALQRLLLLTGSPGGPREAAAGDKATASRERINRIKREREARSRQGIVNTRGGRDETARQDPDSVTTPDVAPPQTP